MNPKFAMRRSILRFLPMLSRGSLAALSIIALAACDKKSTTAKVIGKGHIPAHVEGTEWKEREMDHEQWLVTVEFEAGGRKTDAPVDKSQWDALKNGDRVRVNYSEGQYSHTIWGIDLRKL